MGLMVAMAAMGFLCSRVSACLGFGRTLSLAVLTNRDGRGREVDLEDDDVGEVEMGMLMTTRLSVETCGA